jgi:hypothetical protein
MGQVFFALIVSALAPVAAQAALIETIKVGNWEGGAYTDDNTNSFLSCVVGTTFVNGTYFNISAFPFGGTGIGIFAPTLKLHVGAPITGNLKIDDRYFNTFEGRAISDSGISISFADGDPIFEALRRGRLLTLNSSVGVVQYDLTDTARALSEVKKCVDKHRSFARINAEFQAWMTRNPWFSVPEYAALRDAALRIKSQLILEGRHPFSKDFYSELDQRLTALMQTDANPKEYQTLEASAETIASRDEGERIAIIGNKNQAQEKAANTLTPRRVALVIGNARYTNAPVLKNPPADAASVSAALRDAGFQTVTVKTDLSQQDTLNALREFAALADTADWAVVYYAGHGIEFGGVNYLIPTDARLKADRDVDLEGVDLGKVMAAVEGAKRLRLIILDACRDNPFANQMRRTMASRSIGRGLARVEPEPGTLIAYAAKHGETAMDGTGTRNSPFAEAFVKRIKQTPPLEIRRLFDYVRDDVLKATNKKQQPFSYGSVSADEDFYFLLPQ